MFDVSQFYFCLDHRYLDALVWHSMDHGVGYTGPEIADFDAAYLAMPV